MSETGIENEESYRNDKLLRRVNAGVGLLVWLAVYFIAALVLCLDLFYWRQG